MKKRLMCLLLGVIMLLAIFMTGCAGTDADEEDIANAAIRETQTLVVYLMSEKAVDAKTEYAVEEAINELTKSKFKTQLDLHFFTEDRYYAEVEAKLKAKEKEIKAEEKAAKDKKKYEKWLRESCKQASVSYIPVTTPKPETVITEEATLVDTEYGIIRYVYPDPEPNQLDIFYVGGYDRYNQYFEEDWLARLNDEVSTSSKKLNEHIPSIYMTNLKDDGIYGIPTNSAVGQYTWMLLHKGLMNEYFQTADRIDYLLEGDGATMDEDLFNFLSDVNAYERDEFVPIRGELEPANTYFWTMDPETLRLTNKKSVLGSVYNSMMVKGTAMFGTNLFAQDKFTNQLKMIKRFEIEGFFETEEEKKAEDPKPFAMSVMKGGYDIYLDYCDEYYVKMVESPRAGEDQIYSHMLCVGALEDNIARAMEIVTFINTNSAPRNIIQYGVEGENYYIENGVLHRFNQSYMMDVNKTGNVFMAHPEEGKPADYWDQWVQQNEDARALPVYGFRVEWSSNPDTERIANLEGLYDTYMNEYKTCKTMEELEAFLLKAKEEINANEDYAYVKDANFSSDDDEDPVPIMKIYYDWLVMEYGYGQ